MHITNTSVENVFFNLSLHYKSVLRRLYNGLNIVVRALDTVAPKLIYLLWKINLQNDLVYDKCEYKLT